LPEIKNTLFVVDPSQPFVIDTTRLKTTGCSSLPTFNLADAPALQPHVWGEEDIVKEDVREDVREDTREDARDNREEINFRSFIKTETST
jgi:hypothetical protein